MKVLRGLLRPGPSCPLDRGARAGDDRNLGSGKCHHLKAIII